MAGEAGEARAAAAAGASRPSPVVPSFVVLGAARIAGRALIEPARARGDVPVVAIGASTAGRAAQWAASHGVPLSGGYEDALAAPGADTAYIALTPARHAEWTLKALAAGKHVCLEKPAAARPGEAEAMVAAARAAGLRLIEAFHYRWHPMFARALEWVRGEAQEGAREGALGELVSAEAEFSAPIPRAQGEFRWDAAQGGGALADLGCYCVHWLRHLAGEEPKIVSARQWLEADGIDRRTEGVFAFPSGATARLTADMQPEHASRRAHVTLHGSKGRLDLVNPLAPQYGHELVFTPSDGGAPVRETFSPRPTFAWQLDGWVEALRTGAPTPCEGDDIIANARAMQALRDAAG